MTTKRRGRDRISRRRFLKAAGTALAAGAAGTIPVLSCSPSKEKAAGAKTLRILQWSHFVPGYDAWFDGVYTKEWGAKNGTEVIVDHMSATEINARGAAEAAAAAAARRSQAPMARRQRAVSIRLFNSAARPCATGAKAPIDSRHRPRPRETWVSGSL